MLQKAQDTAGFGPANPCMARLLTNTRITAADHFQDTRHIEFDLGQDGPSYDPGDIITMCPAQDAAAVAKLLKLTGHEAHCRVRIELADAEPRSCGQHAMEVRPLACLDIVYLKTAQSLPWQSNLTGTCWGLLSLATQYVARIITSCRKIPKPGYLGKLIFTASW